MNTKRLLLPFTHGVDRRAIEHALQLAQDREAMLVPLALIRIPDNRLARGVGAIRLEHIQQAKDFLETVCYAAPKYNVTIESHEIATTNVIHSITAQARAMCCESIVLLENEQEGLLLQTHEIAALLTEVPVPCELIHVQHRHKARRKSLQQFIVNSLLSSELLRGYIQPGDVIPPATSQAQSTEVLTAAGQLGKR
jgi:hypothetical protein